MKQIEFLQRDEEFAKDVGSYPSYRVVEFEELDKSKLINADKVVSNRQSIGIVFDYPLNKPTTLWFTKKKPGFTVFDLFRCVYEGYSRIYTLEDKYNKVGYIPGMLNRQTSNGPYGIWGHAIGDLYLEGAYESKPGIFSLSMGS